MDLNFAGKTVLVTGGSRGIGKAIASTFAAAGANLVLAARNLETLQEAAEEIAKATGNGAIQVVAANVTSLEDPQRVVSAALDAFGGLDVLINNAATNPYFGPLIDLDAARADKTYEANIRSVLLWSQAAWRLAFSQQGNGGSIINIASIGGLRSEPGIGFYNATKAAVIHMTRQFAKELGPQVRVNAIAPGLVKTKFARVLWEGKEEEVARRLPLGRLGDPPDIAGAALFLASDLAAWVTGEVLVVDGGALL